MKPNVKPHRPKAVGRGVTKPQDQGGTVRCRCAPNARDQRHEGAVVPQVKNGIPGSQGVPQNQETLHTQPRGPEKAGLWREKPGPQRPSGVQGGAQPCELLAQGAGANERTLEQGPTSLRKHGRRTRGSCDGGDTREAGG